MRDEKIAMKITENVKRSQKLTRSWPRPSIYWYVQTAKWSVPNSPVIAIVAPRYQCDRQRRIMLPVMQKQFEIMCVSEREIFFQIGLVGVSDFLAV